MRTTICIPFWILYIYCPHHFYPHTILYYDSVPTTIFYMTIALHPFVHHLVCHLSLNRIYPLCILIITIPGIVYLHPVLLKMNHLLVLTNLKVTVHIQRNLTKEITHIATNGSLPFQFCHSMPL